MRNIALLILLSISLCSYGQTNTSFASLKFDKVVMYDYEPLGEDPSLFDKNGQLVKNVIIRKEIQLGIATINVLNKKIEDKKSYGQVTASCFDPHLGIAYYLKGKIFRYILICMDCNTLRSDINIPAQQQIKHGEGDKVYYLGDGMSKSFRKFINELLKKYGFSHQIKPGSMFDK